MCACNHGLHSRDAGVLLTSSRGQWSSHQRPPTHTQTDIRPHRIEATRAPKPPTRIVLPAGEHDRVLVMSHLLLVKNTECSRIHEKKTRIATKIQILPNYAMHNKSGKFRQILFLLFELSCTQTGRPKITSLAAATWAGIDYKTFTSAEQRR